jgi:hypothetical protein
MNSNSVSIGLVLGFLALVTGCSAATDDTSIETVTLAGNGELAQLDFLNPIYPFRGNAPPAVVDGKTSLAVARFIDVTRCTTQEDFFRGPQQVCPGTPSSVPLRVLIAACDDGACKVSTIDTPAGSTVVAAISGARPGARLRIRVAEPNGAEHEDTFVLR